MNRDATDLIANTLCKDKGWSTPAFIDAGNSGAVYKIYHPHFGEIALKIYDPEFFSGANALIEAKRVKLQSQLSGHNNPYLIDILDVGEVERFLGATDRT